MTFEAYETVIKLQRGDEFDIFRSQILTSNVDPLTVRVNIFLMGVDP